MILNKNLVRVNFSLTVLFLQCERFRPSNNQPHYSEKNKNILTKTPIWSLLYISNLGLCTVLQVEMMSVADNNCYVDSGFQNERKLF